MNKINWLMCLVGVAACCMYGCNKDATTAVSAPVSCETSDDCEEGHDCEDNVCTSCDDGVKNGDETGVDCGGSCKDACEDDDECEEDDDCGKGYVCKKGVCKKKKTDTEEDKPSCSDDKKNGDETDVDCGGGKCDKCAENKHCSENSDCLSDNCEDGTCKIKIDPCADGEKTGDESDVDCGGSCSTKCADGKTCNAAEDCASNMCDGVCISCADGTKNGNESDIDCGGSCDTKCADGKACNSGEDCANGFCDGNVCTSCSDGVLNGDEADIDCGGRCGANCAVDKPCHSDNDCETYNCGESLCKAIDCQDTAEPGDIIINEVFANPDPEAKMEHSNNKQMKYIELYNKTEKTLQLYNLSLTFGGNEVHAKGCLAPQSYLVIHPAEQTLTALDLDAKTLASDNIDAAISATSGEVKLVKRADSTVIHSATVPETEKGTAAGREQAEESSTNDEAMVPHSSVKTIENGVQNLYTPGLPNNAGFPMG